MVKPTRHIDPSDRRLDKGSADLPLFVHARSRKSDPSTSHEAARRMTKSGVASAQAAAVLAIVRANPGCTSAEVGALMGDDERDRFVAGRRLPDLRAAGKVRNGDKRRCTVKGSMALTWWGC